MQKPIIPTESTLEALNAARAKHTAKFSSARINLFAAAAFTAVNIILMAAGSFSYFLFSFTVPYTIAQLGMYLTGSLPAEYYTDWGEGAFLGSGFLIGTMIAAAVIIGLFVLCGILSKKNRVWLTVALVLFAIDCAFMLYVSLSGGFEASVIIDIAFHAWVMYYLASGVKSAKALSELPDESFFGTAEAADDPQSNG